MKFSSLSYLRLAWEIYWRHRKKFENFSCCQMLQKVFLVQNNNINYVQTRSYAVAKARVGNHNKTTILAINCQFPTWWSHSLLYFQSQKLQIGQVALLSQRDRATCLSVEILQLQNIANVWHYLRDPTFSRFYTIPKCDRHTHTDRRTDRYTTTACTALSIASHGKNRPYCTAHKV